MSHEKVKRISIIGTEVFIDSAASNVWPLEYREAKSERLTAILREKGRKAVEMEILFDYFSGMMQGGSRFPKAIEAAEKDGAITDHREQYDKCRIDPVYREQFLNTLHAYLSGRISPVPSAVGLPNVGKSTLFNCLSNAKAQAANFPFCTIEPNVGVITVPDERLTKLAELVHPGRIVPTTVEIVDIAGLVKGASKGEGLGNKFLANIRETDAILHVLRCFDDENVTHVDGSVDPVRDKEIIDTELQLKDLETIESRIQKVQKQAQTGGDKQAKQMYDILVKYKDALEQGKSARTVQFDSKDEQKIAKELFLLTSKPVMYVCNVDEASAATGNKYVEQVREAVKEENAEILVVAAKTEADIAELETYEDRQMFLQEVGLKESGVNRLIKSAYHLLELETFITAGEMEVKAWTYRKGWKAPQCAGVIHTDFEKGFIRAEVIKYEDYIKYGSEAAVKEAGKMGVEGKEYIVQDGDIMHFRFNV